MCTWRLFIAYVLTFLEDDGSRRLICAGQDRKGLDGLYTFYELNEDGNVAEKFDYNMLGGALAVVHDFLVSENYYIVL